MSNIKGNADFYSPGDWNVVCWVCGSKFKASQMVRHWRGYWVCPKDWESRHPQDFVRGVPDVQTPPWTQPDSAPTFIHFCSLNGMTDIAGYAVSGCVVVGYISPSFDPSVTS